MREKASPIILLALFFTCIDYPFALCVNFNTWEGIRTMRENEGFEQCSCPRVNQVHRGMAFSGGSNFFKNCNIPTTEHLF